MTRLRATKLLCATLLVCTGALCIAIGGLAREPVPGVWLGLILFAVSIPMFIRQWTDRGVLGHFLDLVFWLVEARREPTPAPRADPTAETVGRA